MKRLVLAAALTLGALAPAAAQHQAVIERARHYQPEALKLLERLVSIDSGTGYAEGLVQVGAVAVEELRKLGADIAILPAKPAVGDNIVATWKGSGKGRILLMAHTDTVFPAGTAAARPFRLDGSRAYGPGVSDDKGGIVTAIFALKILNDLNFKDYGQITLLLNSNEETGSRGSRGLIEKLAREHDVTLNLEGGRANDGIVIWRKGSARLTVEVKGRAAHAGNAPQQGRNAAIELANQVLQIAKLGNAEKQTTVNVTVLQAGDRSNVIPDRATAFADVRALVSDEFDRVEREAAAIAKNGRIVPDTEVMTTLVRSFPIMPQNAQTDALARMAPPIRASPPASSSRRSTDSPSSGETRTPTGSISKSPVFRRDSIC
jgi:glutamate carboxypeptidase